MSAIYLPTALFFSPPHPTGNLRKRNFGSYFEFAWSGFEIEK
ncbi:hypothetical protein LEP1GSC061_1477 [Leptospira wolffii serovar Khorat str. Khorat-H2]|nr:hypothetical protein LEP1GSC061_1477 [Leptospira wolffii serovar Khorat str. Khorat-H2]